MLVIDDVSVKLLFSGDPAMLLLSSDPAMLAIVQGSRHFKARTALADQLADAANRHLFRAQELARVARRVRTGER